jgi:IgA Peptidase M64/Viral BACON domain/Putative binding domain, N-terminal
MINQSSRIMPKVLFLLFLFCCPMVALAETYETVVNNGSPQNRVDIAILGDGYTASQMQQYRADVQNFIQGVFAQEPYKEYARYYNVHRVDVISNQSGADHPERNPQVFVDTAFDATYNCADIQRLICVNTSKVFTVIGNSLPSSYFDVVLIIVNDPEYGGSGGSVAVASTNAAVVELILHEVGHSFGLLADEYTGGGPSCNPNFEPPEPNATRETARAFIKWNYWIDPTTPIPTTTTTSGMAGLYEGSKYCDFGLYRPTYDSKMRFLDRPFEQINTEQHVKRIYNLVSPIDSSQPPGNNVMITQGQVQPFSVTTPIPITHTLSMTWFVDGQPQGNGQAFNLDSSTLSIGSHMVEARVGDGTPMVRSDPQQLLSERRSWNVTVQCPFSLYETSQFFTMNGGDGSVNVLTTGGCGWAAVSNASWIVITSANSGNGNGVVTYAVRENFTASARTGTLTIAGLTFTVVQDGGLGENCSYSISPTYQSLSASGGSGAVSVSSEKRCAWQAISNDNWVTITSGNNGIGNGTVTYSVQPNPGTAGRVGKITIAGKIFSVKQKGS